MARRHVLRSFRQGVTVDQLSIPEIVSCLPTMRFLAAAYILQPYLFDAFYDNGRTLQNCYNEVVRA